MVKVFLNDFERYRVLDHDNINFSGGALLM